MLKITLVVCCYTKEMLILILEKYFSYVLGELQFLKSIKISLFKANVLLISSGSLF